MPEIELARETTTFAEAFVHMGVTNPWFYRMLIGRLYYAAHHLGQRLLVEAGLQPEQWRANVHQRVIRELDQHYVRPGRMAPDDLRSLARLRDRRVIADYDLSRRLRLHDVNHALADSTSFAEASYRMLGVN